MESSQPRNRKTVAAENRKNAARIETLLDKVWREHGFSAEQALRSQFSSGQLSLADYNGTSLKAKLLSAARAKEKESQRKSEKPKGQPKRQRNKK